MDRQVDINTALGMVKRPLQAGDTGKRLAVDGVNGGGVFIDHLNRCSEMVKQWPAWKVGVLDDRGQGVVDPPRDEVAELREQLAASKSTLASMQYSEAQHDLACEELGINLFPHEDGDTLIEAVCALKQQLVDVTRERDEARRHVIEAETSLTETCDQRDVISEQLATVQRVLVDSLNLTEVGNEFTPPCVDVDDAMSLAAAAEVAIDTLKLSAEKHKLDVEEANKALAAVQAQLTDWMDAAEALYKAVPVAYERGQLPENGKRKPSEMVKEYLAEVQAEASAMRTAGLQIARCSLPPHDVSGERMFSEARETLLNSTAGRELLDELSRKDERIDDFKRQLADHKREAELCRELRAAIVGRGIGVDPSSNSVYICTTNLNRLRDLLFLIRQGGAK